MKWCLFILGIVVLATNAAADEGAITADELQSLCKLQMAAKSAAPFPRTAEEMVVHKGDVACTFYIAGIINLLLLPSVSNSLQVCILKDMTMDKVRFDVERLMRTVPNEMLEYSAALAIVAALRMNYPCQGKPNTPLR